MNKRNVRMALACVIAGMVVAGCFTASPKIAYYSLYAPEQRPAAEMTVPGSTLAVSIGPVTIPDILKQAQIATGGADGRYRLSEFHRWSGGVDRDLARALAEQLAARLGTEQVAIFPWDQQFNATCRVLVDVLSMGGETGREATLAVRWSLVDPAGKVPPLVRRSDLRDIPAEAGYPAWVAAQQRNIAGLGEEIATAVRER